MTETSIADPSKPTSTEGRSPYPDSLARHIDYTFQERDKYLKEQEQAAKASCKRKLDDDSTEQVSKRVRHPYNEEVHEGTAALTEAKRAQLFETVPADLLLPKEVLTRVGRFDLARHFGVKREIIPLTESSDIDALEEMYRSGTSVESVIGAYLDRATLAQQRVSRVSVVS